MNAITRQINAMRPKRYTTAQAAHLVGRSTDTLARWRTDGVFFPSDARVFGSTRVYLYTQQDITAMRAVVRTLKPGRKPVSQHGRKVTGKGVNDATKAKQGR